MITKRGKVIARIIREDSEKLLLRKALDPLIKQGLITFPSKKLNKTISDPVKVPGKPVSEMVIEERR